jgi:hypothetical protein
VRINQFGGIHGSALRETSFFQQRSCLNKILRDLR